MLRSPLLCVVLLLACGGSDKDAPDTGPQTTTQTTSSTSSTTTTTNDAWPTSPDDYVFGPTSYFHTFSIPLMDTDPCCRDWGAISKDNIQLGTNEPDNALANLRDLTAAMGLDLQATIDDTIESEGFVALLDHQNFPTGDGDYDLAFFRGRFVNGSGYFTGIAGNGQFEVSTYNFDEGTGRPRALFNTANVTAGQLTATGGEIEIVVPMFSTILLVLPLLDVDLTGDLTEDGQISDGVLSGYITVDDFYNGYNTVVDELCGCLGLTTPLYVDNGTALWDDSCVSDPAALCTTEPESTCVTMAGSNLLAGELCTVIPSLMNSSPDLDLDGDTSTFEALSVGFRYSAASAEITGLR
ncbi:MAG: hypothetical protein GWP91_12095 [Rhodobacterales bacterium]|nr:hypothetical protein [Rhodobacterales bacterium]